ncbi:DUF4265 domain-containing protein [Archangium sp.]|uniref:DUF4265 domain-containing protein n=1 Tax=Archangium sp. TaxID=1872627 RepID=UPI002D5C6F80|nr:DUF4265 domain-containing protein [Archangium sp.]HYO52303.1 DUF4265 domain-containing protein [Archangium sp.]
MLGATMTSSKNGDWVKVVVKLEKDEDDYPPADYENLWAVPVGGGLFRIDNIPFFAKSIALGDIVSADPEQGLLKFKEVVKPSGHSTIRLIVYDEAEVPSVLEHFEKLGCTNEKSHIPGLVALDVPPSVSLDALRQVLDSGMEQKRWDYEEACLGTLMP